MDAFRILLNSPRRLKCLDMEFYGEWLRLFLNEPQKNKTRQCHQTFFNCLHTVIYDNGSIIWTHRVALFFSILLKLFSKYKQHSKLLLWLLIIRVFLHSRLFGKSNGVHVDHVESRSVQTVDIQQVRVWCQRNVQNTDF